MADKSLDRSTDHLDNTTWDHKWGFTDSGFIINPDKSIRMTGQRYELSGHDLPEMLPFVEKMLQITIELDNIRPEVQPKPVPDAIVNQAFCDALEGVFDTTQYTSDPRERLIHSHGQTTSDELYPVLYGKLARVADLVAYPQSSDDVATLVTLAKEHDVCLVPYGGGTSVSCALKLPVAEKRMIVMVDMRRLNKIIKIDQENNLAVIEAGITGSDMERELEKKGFISGHEPDSMELSTLGGWIATNASGMKKNRYGNIEDIVQNVTMITPEGVIEQLDAQPRYAMGMRPQSLMFGSEGNLGIITKATIRIHPAPEEKRYGSIVFPDFWTGADYLYEISRAGLLPASIRLLDNIQFRFGSALRPRATQTEKLKRAAQRKYLLNVKGFDPNELCAATIVMEGSKNEVDYQQKELYRIAKKFRGIPGGEDNGKRGYMLTYAIAYIRDLLMPFHLIGETYETTVPWSQIRTVCESVHAAALEKHAEYGLEGIPYVSPRITQLYHTGVCIYFTHGFSVKGVADAGSVLHDIEHRMREVIMEHGGSISHHHGVGKLRNEFMRQTISPASISMLQTLKETNDPQNIFGIRNNVFAD